MGVVYYAVLGIVHAFLISPMSEQEVDVLYYVGPGVVLLVLCLVVTPILAVRKGYAWYVWVLPGLIGLIALAFLPHANRPGADAAFNRDRRETGNIVGLILSWAALALLCLTCISTGLLLAL